MYILSPRHRKKEEKESGEEDLVLTGFGLVPVFRYEDTEGEELIIEELLPKSFPPLMDVANKWGINVRYFGFQGDAYGYYSPSRKEIVLATHDEQTFFHELAHVAHEKVKGKLKGGQDWKQEIVAELTSAVLMHLYGRRSNDGGAYRYIRQYAQKADKDVYKACMSVISDVEKCLEVIVGILVCQT